MAMRYFTNARQVRRHLMARRVIPGSAEEIVADCVRTLISTA
jgi:hypothetical protein